MGFIVALPASEGYGREEEGTPWSRGPLQAQTLLYKNYPSRARSYLQSSFLSDMTVAFRLLVPL